jgi:hypothetical protein
MENVFTMHVNHKNYLKNQKIRNKILGNFGQGTLGSKKAVLSFTRIFLYFGYNFLSLLATNVPMNHCVAYSIDLIED